MDDVESAVVSFERGVRIEDVSGDEGDAEGGGVAKELLSHIPEGLIEVAGVQAGLRNATVYLQTGECYYGHKIWGHKIWRRTNQFSDVLPDTTTEIEQLFAVLGAIQYLFVGGVVKYA